MILYNFVEKGRIHFYSNINNTHFTSGSLNDNQCKTYDTIWLRFCITYWLCADEWIWRTFEFWSATAIKTPLLTERKYRQWAKILKRIQNLLNKEEYEALIVAFDLDETEPTKQTNIYFDTPDFKLKGLEQWTAHPDVWR